MLVSNEYLSPVGRGLVFENLRSATTKFEENFKICDEKKS